MIGKSNKKKKFRCACFAFLTTCLAVTWACVYQAEKTWSPEDPYKPIDYVVFSRNLDILFVIDNSHSMAAHQEKLRTGFSPFFNGLSQISGGLPNLHIGVITSDLGAGNHSNIIYCEEIGGDRGVLGKVGNVNLGEQCIGVGQRYIVDVEPAGCEIRKNPEPYSLTCESHACSQANCDHAAKAFHNLTFYENEFGCPRCKNYEGEITDVFSCYADVGIHGCGFEQQLEAGRKALNPSETPVNKGFFRDDGFLAVVVVTDEDDCSSSMPDVMYNPDPDQDDIDSQLGYLHSFRCFEFGINCHINDRSPGERLNCTHERNDPNMMLHPLERYTSFIEALKDPMMLIVGSIAAPVPEVIMVGTDESDRPMLMPSCRPPDSPYGADPAVRINAFVNHFNRSNVMEQWAYSNVCSPDFSPALQSLAESATARMGAKCSTLPFAGCLRGPPGTLCSPCLPMCNVYEYETINNVNQKMEIKWCGEVCRHGLCTQADMNECDFDAHGFCHCPDGQGPTTFGPERNVYCAPLLYHDGPPDVPLDPRPGKPLPRVEPPCQEPDCMGRASACWYLSADERCTYRAVFRVIRSEEVFRPIVYPRCVFGVATDTPCLTSPSAAL